MESFRKPCVFITSLGRTGTNFFGDNMMHMIEGCTSVHEPDLLYFDSMLYRKIREFGFFRMTVGKFSPRHSIRGLNIARQSGKLFDDEIIASIRQIRKKVFHSLESTIYLESNCSWSSLVDLLPIAFPNSRIAYIIRDPRSWTSSWLNSAIARYSLHDVRSWFKDTRLTPYHIDGDPYQKKWKKMTIFEKFCWSWARENAYALKCAEKTPSVEVFKFEDLFEEKRNYETMAQMLEFLTEFPNGYKASWVLDRVLMRQKINMAGRKRFPEWTEWNIEQIHILNEHCGDLMKLFNYGNEPEWKQQLNQ